MQRPVGYGVIALLVALVSLSRLAGAALMPPTLQGIAMSILPRLLGGAAGLLGLWAAWWAWTYHHRAPEAFAAWAVVNLGSGVYYRWLFMPRVMGLVQREFGAGAPPPSFGLRAFIRILAYAVLAGIGYWYLQRQRRPGGPSATEAGS